MDLCSIFIIDDNEADRYVLKRQLEEIQLTKRIFEADDGKTAIEFLSDYDENFKKYPKEFPPILIFLDINMPFIGGLEFLEHFAKLRQKRNFDSCVLMMFTSSETERDKKTVFAYDFVRGYIVKMPPTSEDLKKSIVQACPELFI